MAWIAVYAAGAVLTAIAAWVFGCCASVDTGKRRRAVLAVIAGLCWPVVGVGVLQLLAVRLVAIAVRLVDRPLGVTPAGRIPNDGRFAWQRRAAGT